MSLTRYQRTAEPSAMNAPQLAHELNNLLDGSLRSVALAQRGIAALQPPIDAADILRRLHAADQSMQLMAEVIARFIQPGQSSPALVVSSRGSLLEAMTHAINVYGPPMRQRSIELVTRLAPDIADAPAGPIYTVLANALNNAIQAIDDSDAPTDDHIVNVRIDGEAQRLVVNVSDTGCGIAPALLDAQGRVRPGRSTRGRGHGVGLGVCRQIAEDLGGSLTLRNNPVDHGGRGATLTLDVPRWDTDV